MLELLGAVFQKVGLVIGTTLISVGSLFSGASLPETVELSDTVVASSTTDAIIGESVNEDSVKESPTVPQNETGEAAGIKEILPVKTEVINPEITTLQIEDIEVDVEGDEVEIKWHTSLPSESRVFFDGDDGRVFESQEGLSTYHEVRVGGLVDSSEYDFKIAATTDDKSQYDDYYGVVQTEVKYVVAVGSVSEECTTILIKDSFGRIAKNVSVTLIPTHEVGSNTYQKPRTSETTNSSGEIKYCEIANTIRVKGPNFDVTLTRTY